MAKLKNTSKQSNPSQEQLAILDAGAQYGKVIDRRVRELAVESVLLPLDTPTSELKKYKAFIISGGPQSVYSKTAPKFNPDIFSLGKPVFGICYGLHLMNFVAGGTVEKKSKREDGPCQITIETDSPLFAGLEQQQQVLMTHGDTLDQPGAGYRVIADSDGLIAGIENQNKQHFAVQFHPEVDLTENGKQILQNFLFNIAGFSGSYTLENREEKAIEYIKDRVGDKKVLILVSGGVDSTVCAALLSKALPKEQIYALHVDSGFMRQDESKLVKKALEEQGIDVQVVDAEQTFLNATTEIDGLETKTLRETTNPEEKRKIIGDTFMVVAQQAIEDLGLAADDVILAQGTLRPDLIESASSGASKVADTIKTHHNDTFLVRQLRDQGKVIEPLSEYHKDEVRELGTELGLPEELVWRQPFPGPGLAIRILCATEKYQDEGFADVRQQVQSFSTAEHQVELLPVRTVGVQGDGRSYSYLAGIFGPEKWDELFAIARELPKTVHAVNRVAYFFGEKSAEAETQTITKTLLREETLDQLRKADAIVNELLLEHDLIKPLSQLPVVLVPLDFGEKGARTIALRTFITNDFMTGVPAVPGKQMPVNVLHKMVDRILAEVPGIVRVAYDLTSKPPGTTEWE